MRDAFDIKRQDVQARYEALLLDHSRRPSGMSKREFAILNYIRLGETDTGRSLDIYAYSETYREAFLEVVEPLDAPVYEQHLQEVWDRMVEAGRNADNPFPLQGEDNKHYDVGLAFIHADGNCAFSLLGYAARREGTVSLGLQLRPLLARFIAFFWNCHVPGSEFTWSMLATDYEDADSYYTAMTTTMAYGGLAEFRAWATLMGCELRVFYDSD